MDRESLDLSPLDPSMDPERWERMIATIRFRAAPELARRTARAGVLGIVADWAWPTLVAATLAAVVSGAALAAMGRDATGTSEYAGVAAALNVSEPISQWIDQDRQPTKTDLLAALEGGVR